jgi:hypothetical protein
MAATILINRHTGAGTANGGTVFTDITSGNTRASTSDAPTPGTSDPIPIPGAGNNYSFWVSTRLQSTVAPSGTVDNLRWYSDAAGFGTGVTVSGADASTGADVGYRIGVGTQGTTGTQLTTGNHTGLDAAEVDVTGLTSGSPRTLGGSTTTTEHFGDLFVYQFDVGTTASAGTTPANTFTFQYDET